MIDMIVIAMIDVIVMTEMIVTTGVVEMTNIHDGRSSKSVFTDCIVWYLIGGLTRVLRLAIKRAADLHRDHAAGLTRSPDPDLPS